MPSETRRDLIFIENPSEQAKGSVVWHLRLNLRISA